MKRDIAQHLAAAPYFRRDAVQSDHALCGPPDRVNTPDSYAKLGERINRSGLWRTDGAQLGRAASAMLGAVGLSIPIEILPSIACEKGAAWPTCNRRTESIEVVLLGGNHRRAHRCHGAAHRAVGLDDLLVVAVLKGSFVFAADLLRALYRRRLVAEVDFLSLSSYRMGTSARRDASRSCATSRSTSPVATCS